MICATLQIGTEIAQELRDASENIASSPAAPRTVADLLALWAITPPRELPVLRTTCARFSDYLRIPANELLLDDVERSRKGFRPYLKTRKLTDNSIRTYVNHVRILLKSAIAAGWALADAVSAEWSRVIDLADASRCGDLARHLAQLRSQPGQVLLGDVDDWVRQVAGRDFVHRSAVNKRTKFWRIMRDCGHLNQVPLSIRREIDYGIKTRDFPAALKKEVTDLLKWKQDFYVYDRPAGARHRPATARRLEQLINALYGYAIRIKGEAPMSSLSELAQQHIVGSYIGWCLTERGVKGQSVQRDLRLLLAVLRQHPRYEGVNIDWFKPMLEGIPVEPESTRLKRKAEKTLDYSVIEAIPNRIHAERAQAGKQGPRKLALVVRDELLIRWLSVLPWRQRNLRECRIAGASPNLYKGPVPEITTIDMPSWAEEERRRNPSATFWQFHFTEEETKAGCAVDSLLPRQLIEPLEEYLELHRKNLLRAADPGTLFLNQNGSAMSADSVKRAVENLTIKHGGRRVTPHLFRDIVCVARLKDNSKDYLSVAKLLWHSGPDEVIKTYGSLFNASSGTCLMESWLEERARKTKN